VHAPFALFAATAALSAWVGEWLGIPLGAMIGPMLCVALLSHVTGNPRGPGPDAHHGAILIIGIALGAQISSDLFEKIALWPLSLLTLVVTMCVVLWTVGYLNRRLIKLDPLSCHMAAAPGNLSLALAVTETRGGKLPQVAVYQSLRLALITLMVPFLFVLPDTSTRPAAPFQQADFLIWLGLLSVGWLLTSVLRTFNTPTPGLIAGVGVAGTVSMTGWLSIQTPALFVALAMMLFGWKIGIDIVRQGLKTLIWTIPPALISTLAAVALAMAGALTVHWALGFPRLDTVLAFMPGAFQVMPVVALEAGGDGLYVTTHHLVRVLSMGVLIPIFASRWSAE
jgi:membrane AbrB-like protein